MSTHNLGDSQGQLFAAPIASFDAARLTQARRLAGLSKRQIADELGVTPVAVGQWESGAQPRPYHVQALARLFDLPLEFFSSGRAYARLESANTHFRSLRKTPARERDRAVAFTEQIWEVAHAIETRVELPPVSLPGFSGGEAEIRNADPVEAASMVRKAWGLPSGPVKNLVRLLEHHGIIVTMSAFAGDKTATVDAFSTSHLPRPVVVLTPDRADDVYRHRFTAAHELGHLVLHGEVEPGDPVQEREADAFAAAFLTPQHELAPVLPDRMDMRKLSTVSARWGVDVASLVYRARELNRISETSYRRAFQRLAQLRKEGAYVAQSVAKYPGEQPQLLLQAYRLAETSGLDVESLAERLKLPTERIRMLIGLESQRPVLRLV